MSHIKGGLPCIHDAVPLNHNSAKLKDECVQLSLFLMGSPLDMSMWRYSFTKRDVCLWMQRLIDTMPHLQR